MQGGVWARRAPRVSPIIQGRAESSRVHFGRVLAINLFGARLFGGIRHSTWFYELLLRGLRAPVHYGLLLVHPALVGVLKGL